MNIASIEQLGEAFEEFKRNNDAAIRSLKEQYNGQKERGDRLEATLKRAHRGEYGDGGGARTESPEVKAFGKYVCSGDDASLAELKAMSVDSQPGGGYMVLPQVSSEIYKTARDVSPLRDLAHSESLSSGDAWEQIISPNRTDTAWASEREARAQGQQGELKQLRIPLHENFANVPVTQKVIDTTSPYNVAEHVLEETGLSFGEDEAIAFTTGDGVKRPRGFLTYPVSTDADATRAWGSIQFVKTGAAGAFATASASVSPADVLSDAFYALKSAYRRNATWLMNSKTAGVVRKMKDAEGRFIWSDGLQVGQPPMLLGRPVQIEENMPDIAADSLSIALADWRRAYVIVDMPGIKTLRDPFTSKPNVLFYSYVRVGGGLRDSRAIKLIKFAA